MSSVGQFSPNAFKRILTSLNSARFMDDTGTIEYFGQKSVILRADVFHLIHKELTRLAGTSANVILSFGGRRVGTEEGAVLMTKARSVGLGDASASPDFIQIALEETNMGFGKLSLVTLDKESGSVTVSISDCFEADARDRSSHPTCFFTLGYLEGVLSKLLGKTVKGIETTCGSKGDEACTFQLKPHENIGPLP